MVVVVVHCYCTHCVLDTVMFCLVCFELVTTRFCKNLVMFDVDKCAKKLQLDFMIVALFNQILLNQ